MDFNSGGWIAGKFLAHGTAATCRDDVEHDGPWYGMDFNYMEMLEND